jgi:hypothetical protein
MSMQHERETLSLETLKMLSTARCARLSYAPFDGEASYEAELKRFEGLVVNRPVHASPAEHQATPDAAYPEANITRQPQYKNPKFHGNFRGWIQHRKLLDNEQVSD